MIILIGTKHEFVLNENQHKSLHNTPLVYAIQNTYDIQVS